ncbi:TOM1-like protein 2 isoform X2 [Drosophila grimshawi]|uniref:TOM1-like protein 2 isoform X2 n=1 Tax=Drosophila grimshawi TaxID=7222 RepID=UPI000C8702B0|nr:TOM1-like protein 2 isoform X2 [Drosophila grimshawi]
MASFFNVGALGNVFSTPIGQRIEAATDGGLASENWAANMEICDMINESSDTARDAMRAIRKRLSQNAGKNNQVIMYTLTVLETCVKNCGKAFHVLVAQKDFINDLVKLIGPKNDPPAIMQEKVLSLIQIWADAFKNQPDLNGVTQMYMELKNKGIEFPPTDLDAMAPIYTPQRSVPEVSLPHPQLMAAQHTISPQHAAAAAVTPATGPLHLTAEQVAKLRSELEVVSNNMSILAEMLSVMKPGQEQPDDYALLNELTATCKEMQSRIVDLIGRVQDDELTAEFLRINDELNNVFLRHQRYEKSRAQGNASAIAVTSPSAVLGAAMGVPGVTATTATAAGAGAGSVAIPPPSSTAVSNTPQSDQLLIDLIESSEEHLPQSFGQLQLGGAAGGAAAAAAGPGAGAGAASITTGAADEFDMLAQSRTDGNHKSDLLRDIPSVDAAAGSVASPYKQLQPQSAAVAATAATSPQQQQRATGDHPPVVSKSTKENEIDEMEAWLGSSDVDGIEELTSSEFDKFLEERAAAAENLPTINASNSATTGLGLGAAGDNSLRKTPKKPGADEDLLAL